MAAFGACKSNRIFGSFLLDLRQIEDNLVVVFEMSFDDVIAVALVTVHCVVFFDVLFNKTF